MEEAYLALAGVYDELMDDTPYEKWRDRIVSVIREHGVSETVRGMSATVAEHTKDTDDADKKLASERDLVLELGCGTGRFTELMYEAGYDMIGIDSSEEMLNIAMKRKRDTGSDILYLCQDMRELDLYSTVGTVISIYDSINYITDGEELSGVFGAVNKFLYPGGLFIFDFNTEYKYRVVNADNVFAENRENVSFIWENYYDEESKLNEFDLTLFVREDEASDIFRKYEETHIQRGYTAEEIKDMLRRAGFFWISMSDMDSGEAVCDTTERVLVVAKGEK